MRHHIRRSRPVVKETLYHPLAWLVLLVSLTIIILRGVTVVDVRHWFDPPMLTITSAAYFLSALSILVRTKIRLWSILGAGLLATMLADAVFWAWVLLDRLDVSWVEAHQGDIFVVLRALFFVGSLFVVTGLCQEWVQDRGDGVFTRKRWVRNRPGVNRGDEKSASS